MIPAQRETLVHAEVRRAALDQLLKGRPLAESIHVVLVLVESRPSYLGVDEGLALGRNHAPL